MTIGRLRGLTTTRARLRNGNFEKAALHQGWIFLERENKCDAGRSKSAFSGCHDGTDN